ncbi:MAG: YnfA family protein [Campylobacteraceae bacterium]|jgi:small multidrug resistance family-3 protein|nr:YnfA family protein [Campylobacteraceae bacterium]
MLISKSLLIFFWQDFARRRRIYLWLRGDKHWNYGLFGGVILAFYGVVVTWQPSNFARVYAAYGGVFILMSMLWAMKFDNYLPDKYDVIGVLIALLGVFIIYFAPRG